MNINISVPTKFAQTLDNIIKIPINLNAQRDFALNTELSTKTITVICAMIKIVLSVELTMKCLTSPNAIY